MKNKLKLEVTEYYGIFYKQTKDGRWRKFETIGNAEIAVDIAHMFRRLGNSVKIIFTPTKE